MPKKSESAKVATVDRRSILVTKHDDRTNSMITLNSSGIWYQELLTTDRPQSKRVKVGHLVLVDGVITPEYKEWDDYAANVFTRRSLEKQIKVLQDLEKSYSEGDSKDEESLKATQSKLEDCKMQLLAVDHLIECDPIHSLTALTGKVQERVSKIVNSSTFKHKVEQSGDSVIFTHYQSKEFFLENEAKSLCKRHNEQLEKIGAETGYLDIETAREIIGKRFSNAKVKA